MMPKAKVSRAELGVLSSFGGLPLYQLGELQSRYDPNDEESVKWAIRTYIAPIIEAWDKHNPGFRKRLKYALWYYIHHQPWHPADLFARGDPNVEETLPELNYYV